MFCTSCGTENLPVLKIKTKLGLPERIMDLSCILLAENWEIFSNFSGLLRIYELYFQLQKCSIYPKLHAEKYVTYLNM